MSSKAKVKETRGEGGGGLFTDVSHELKSAAIPSSLAMPVHQKPQEKFLQEDPRLQKEVRDWCSPLSSPSGHWSGGFLKVMPLK